MTGKEKAINIGENNLDKCFGSERDYGVACALEMSKWKDEQFSKFLLWLDDNYIIRRFTDGEPMTYGELIEAFKDMNK